LSYFLFVLVQSSIDQQAAKTTEGFYRLFGECGGGVNFDRVPIRDWGLIFGWGEGAALTCAILVRNVQPCVEDVKVYPPRDVALNPLGRQSGKKCCGTSFGMVGAISGRKWWSFSSKLNKTPFHGFE
jgi:hypothetical protein